MKRILSIIALTVLCSQVRIVFAQESGVPSEGRVLGSAWSKYLQDKGPGAKSPSEVPYTPILISFVPGISFPFGYYDSSLAAGAIGSITRDIEGAEGSGVFNISRDVRGIQGAGVFNIARDVLGFQGAGVFNISQGKLSGLQSAGVFNIAGIVRAPFQAAGVFNIVDEIYGFQGAGIFNIAGSVAGGQAAGLFNKADRVAGIQVGLVNVARHIDGVQIGLVNIAGNGVDSVGVSYEPITGYAYAHWQAGAPALYTVAGVGAPSGDWLSDFTSFVASLGLGSRAHWFGLNLDFDISAEQPIGTLPYKTFDWSGDWRAWEGWSMLKPYPSIRLTAGLPIGRHFQIIGGVKADIDVDALGNRVPQALKAGEGWRGSLFDGGFTVWPKWFLGVKI
jgi:hypothetical protein